MKAYINRDELIKIINERTVFSRATDVPDHFKWYQLEDGSFLSWDFAVMDKVLVDVEPNDMIEKHKIIELEMLKESNKRLCDSNKEILEELMGYVSMTFWQKIRWIVLGDK